MKRTRVLVGIGGAIALALAIGFMASVGRLFPLNQNDSLDTSQVALGAQVYREHCAACHGADLEGQPDWQRPRPDGRLPAPAHDQSGHTWHHADEVLFRITKYGMSNLVPGYESDMPAYAELLTDEEIVAVLTFIKSRWPADIQARQANISRRSQSR